LEKIRAKQIKKMGQRVPLPHPLLHINCLPEIPLRRIEEVPVDNISLIHLNHKSLNPICFITCKIASCSMVLKAFAKSNFKMIIGFLEA
jgi:hypothetical protein